MPRIAIVGAGIAGLNAALTLQDAGLSCDLYEAADHVGGRMHSDATTWADGMVSEWCGEFIGSDHTTMRQLITRFGLSTAALDAGSSERAQALMFFLDRYADPEAMARDFQALAPLLRQQLQDAGFPTTYDHFTQAGFELDHLSAHEWIERHVVGGHATVLGRYLDVACSGVYGLDTGEQSALNLVYLMGSRDLSSGSTMTGAIQGNSKIVGGNARLPLAIARALPDGCIHLGQRLVALELSGDGAPSLTFATPGGPSQVSCDRVILALPFSILRHVDYQRARFDPLKKTAIEQLGYGTISKLFLEFDQPYWYANGPWPQQHGSFLVTDLEVQTFWDASLGQQASHGLLVDYTSGHRGAAYAPAMPYTTTADSAHVHVYARDCLTQLERIYPGISAHYTEKAALSYPTGDPSLLGSYSCWRIGQYTQFAGYERVRQGPIHFAGEHCSVELQGYMEGAAREGARAAQEVAQDIR
ncbi:MAG TPA: NAD(P)/FAD-dependent oxidoreductase [Ktedonobacterales bacterium]